MGRSRMTTHVCPVCEFPGLADPPRSAEGGGSYEICPSCGFEFGVTDDDLGYSYEEWKREWILDGCPWRSTRPRPVWWTPSRESPPE